MNDYPKGDLPNGWFAQNIGLVGFEPTASTSRTWRSSQAEPQPVKKKRRLDRPTGEVNLGFPYPHKVVTSRSTAYTATDRQ